MALAASCQTEVVGGPLAAAGGDRRAFSARLARWLALAAALSLGLHLWPLQGARAWDLAVPWNAALAAWAVFLVARSILRRNLAWLPDLPHVGICAYAALVLASAAVAPDLGRALAFSLKVFLSLIALHVLIVSAVREAGDVTRIGLCLAASTALSVTACLAERWAYGGEGFGFFRSGLKYGTFLGLMLPMAAGSLLSRPTRPRRLIAFVLVLGGGVSVGTLGGLVAVVAGLFVLILALPSPPGRAVLMAAVVVAAVLVILILPANPSLVADAALVEPTGDCAQRYIEWQAFVNLMGSRPAAGTGAGNINAYRSEYYGPLPKNNTIAPFDQNLWLAVPAEVGWLGLVALVWGLIGHGRICLGLLRSRQAPAGAVGASCLAALTGGCVGSLFSSATYHGLLIALGMVLALSSAAQRMESCTEES